MTNLVHELSETELDQVCGGELDMIRLQSMVAQRHLAIQLTTHLIRSMNDATRSIIGNIK